ncbi:winged helix-turn-helix transcriptional regulator [Allorhizocola rhizosphaerae]|uniref:winged helix-turn-helix transcriptional regulator n=1 Tax=Allorhizocola rhizosphaerae TaxID=1872709 RepID=UPI000E3C54DF|nr:helix-turn-helix domain-containing protein [Allorhizocola rhizosphaerae]
MTVTSPLAQANTPTTCPLTAAMNAIGGRWSLICLYWLDTGPKRFNELRRLMPDISHKVLTETLRNLEREDLIHRAVVSETPIHVEYTTSPHGHSVRPLIHAIRAWGRAHLEHSHAQH